jgi:hypothetical protein
VPDTISAKASAGLRLANMCCERIWSNSAVGERQMKPASDDVKRQAG